VDIVGYRAVLSADQRHPEVAAQQLDSHSRLLLADAIEGEQPLVDLEHVRARLPNRPRRAVVASQHTSGRRADPARNGTDETVQRGRLRNGPGDGTALARQTLKIEVAEPARQQVWPRPGTLRRNALSEEHADQEGLRTTLDELVSRREVGEAASGLGGAGRGQLVGEVTQEGCDADARTCHQRRGPLVRKNTHRVQVSFAAALKSLSGLKTSSGSDVTWCVGLSHIA